MAPLPPGKIAFANQLRGLAVLLVVLSHYAGTYWTARELTALYIFAPVLQGPTPAAIRWLTLPHIDYGPFGVAVFFLISGFVIPFSLQKLGAARFMAARLLRIYPTYWVATAVTMAVLWLSARYWHQPWHVDAKRLVANLLLVQSQSDQPSIDLVNWTLAVELRFYLVAMLLWPLVRRRPLVTVVGFALAVLAYLRWFPKAWNIVPIGLWQTATANTNAELLFLPFLFIGTLFHLALTRRISTRELVCAALVVLWLFLAMWKHTPYAPLGSRTSANYGYALVLFTACYAIRARFRANRVLDFFADISYPLYIVHALTGYVVIRATMAGGVDFVPAALLALGTSVLLAWGLHRAVELPTVKLGRRIARRPPRAAPTGAVAP